MQSYVIVYRCFNFLLDFISTFLFFICSHTNATSSTTLSSKHNLNTTLKLTPKSVAVKPQSNAVVPKGSKLIKKHKIVRAAKKGRLGRKRERQAAATKEKNNVQYKHDHTQQKDDGLFRMSLGYHTLQVREFEELVEETIPNHTDTQSIEGWSGLLACDCGFRGWAERLEYRLTNLNA